MKPLNQTLAYFGLQVGILFGAALGALVGLLIAENQFPPITKVFADFGFVQNIVFHTVLFAVICGMFSFFVGSNIEDKLEG